MIYQTSYIPPDNVVHSAGEHLSVLWRSFASLREPVNFKFLEIEVMVRAKTQRTAKNAKDRKER